MVGLGFMLLTGTLAIALPPQWTVKANMDSMLDPNKGQIVGLDPQDTPVIVAEDKTLVAVAAQMPHKENLRAGVTYFLLYQNPHGAIKSQTYVTILMGKVKLEHVPVR